MKHSAAVVGFVFAVMTSISHAPANAQVKEDSGLPSGGENSPPVSIDSAPPVESSKEFNQDVDDFEKKISKEVPPTSPKPGNVANPSNAASPGNAAEKARATMKKSHDQNSEQINSAEDTAGGNGIAARKAARKAGLPAPGSKSQEGKGKGKSKGKSKKNSEGSKTAKNSATKSQKKSVKKSAAKKKKKPPVE